MENNYNKLITCQQKEVIIELCNIYLDRIKKPQDVLPDCDISLAKGAAGIILLLSEINKVLHVNTDEIIFDYLQYIKKNIPSYSRTMGLYVGITGLAYAVSFQNERTGQYNKLLLSLDKVIIDLYNLYHNELIQNNYVIYTYDQYDVIYGLSGFARYVLKRSLHSEQLSEIIYFIQDDIYRVYNIQKKNCIEMNGFATNRYLFDEKTNTYYWSNDYSYNIGMAHGIPGIISVLSLICIKGKINQNGMYVLKELVKFMLDISEKADKRLLPSELELNYESTSSWRCARCAWCYGNPGVAASMHLASKALKSQTIKDAQSKLISNIGNSEFSKWMISSPMLCHGFAGVLEILLRVGEYEIIQDFDLIDKIIECINYNKKYCFYNNHFGNIKDTCGFLEGSTGIVLTLLNFINKDEPSWDQVLLLS